jgi:hypothetical protein
VVKISLKDVTVASVRAGDIAGIYAMMFIDQLQRPFEVHMLL